MAENKLSNLSLEELQTKQKKLQGAVIGLGIVLVAACIALIYLAIVGNNYSLIAVTIGCSITMLPSIIVLHQLKTEIKKRDTILKTLKQNK